MRIACVGDCCVDRYLPADEVFLGGITANFARHAVQAFPDGDRICIVSAIGTDERATRVVGPGLEETGIECHLTEIDGRSPEQLIELRPDGEKHFIRYDEGVLRDFRIGDSQAAVLTASDLVVTQTFRQVRGMFESVMRVPNVSAVAVDFADFAEEPDFPQLEHFIDRIDVAFFGLDSAQSGLVDRIGSLAGRHDGTLIVTLGAAGGVAFRGSERREYAARPVPAVVDTTGAGDALAAGVLSVFAHGGTLQNGLECGARRAAAVVQYKAAFRSSPG